jgi:hypothetical protein
MADKQIRKRRWVIHIMSNQKWEWNTCVRIKTSKVGIRDTDILRNEEEKKMIQTRPGSKQVDVDLG